jgi:hypothetical protein
VEEQDSKDVPVSFPRHVYAPLLSVVVAEKQERDVGVEGPEGASAPKPTPARPEPPRDTIRGGDGDDDIMATNVPAKRDDIARGEADVERRRYRSVDSATRR